MAVDRLAAEKAIGDFLRALDLPDMPSVAETPRRVVDAYADELLTGYSVDLPQLLADGSEPAGGNPGMVVVRDIDVATLCPHHLMPSRGTATVAYLPGRVILGLGTIARLVEAFSRRLSLQETIGEQVVATLMEHGARGAFCRLELSHSCLSARGSRQTRATVVTSASAGDLASQGGRSELQLAIGEDSRG